MQRAGIDNPCSPDTFVANEVGVAVQNVVELLLIDGPAKDAQVVAMNNLKRLAIELQPAGVAEAAHLDFGGVALEPAPVPVVVPEHERRRQPGQEVEDLLRADVAAMDVERRAIFPEQFDRRPSRLDAVVGVTENPNDHQGRVAVGVSRDNPAADPSP